MRHSPYLLRYIPTQAERKTVRGAYVLNQMFKPFGDQVLTVRLPKGSDQNYGALIDDFALFEMTQPWISLGL